MSKSKPEIEPLWSNLKYATLSDVRKELPGTLSAWIMVSVFAVGIGWFAGSAQSAVSTWESPLPHWANYAIVCSVVLWFMRGKTFHYRFPMVSIGAWFGFCLYLAALCFVATTFPWWIAVPVYWGTLLVMSLLDTLDAQGKENCQAFEAARA